MHEMHEMPFGELPVDLPYEEPAPATWPPAQLGLKRCSVQAGHYQLSYVTAGSGPAVVLLHGLGGSSYAWRYTLPALAQHYTVYAFDMLGCGESAKPHITYTVEALATSVAEGMVALGLEHTHLIGHSLGGGVAMKVWELLPTRIDRVVLVASGGMGRAMHWLLRISTLPGAQGVLGALSSPRLPVTEASRAMERRRLRRLQVAPDEQQLMTVLDRLHDPAARYAFLSILRNSAGLAGQRLSAHHQMAALQSPVLLIWGARDRTIPPEHGMLAVQLMPHAQLEILAQCFHRPQIEAPEIFNALVLRFLAVEAWSLSPPNAIPHETRRILRQEWLRRRLAPAALAVTVPAGLSFWLRTRRRRRARLPR